MNIFIELLKSIVFGIVQGITEWLPISSTGHMILLNQFMPLNFNKSFVDTFIVVIQFGSILAVIYLYFNKLNPFSSKKNELQRKETFSLWGKVLMAVIPAAIVGLLFDNVIDNYFYNWPTVAITLIIYGILFIIVERKPKKPTIKKFNEITYKTAFYIGIFQVLALIPGTSRSGATILGAILLGASRFIAAEFSFFLAVPVMFGASFLKLIKAGISFTAEEWIILFVGMVAAFVVSVFAIKFLMNYIKRHDFTSFGWYRIILAIIIILYFMITPIFT